jgi:hypothetical protein
MAIGWRLATFGVVKGGGESSPSFLGGFGGHGLLLAVWDSSTRSRLWFGWPVGGKTVARISPWGYADGRHVKEVKRVWFWDSSNFSLGLVQ